MKSLNLHTCPIISLCPSFSFSFQMSQYPSPIVPVHSRSLGELIAALTALVQYSVKLLTGPHEAQPSQCAIWPPSHSLHLSLCVLSLSSSPSEWLHFPPLLRFIVLPARPHCHPSLTIFLLPPTSLMHLPALLFSHPSTISPLFPLCSNEGVRSAIINDRLNWVCARVHMLCWACALFLFHAKESRLINLLIDVSACVYVCIWSRYSIGQYPSPLPHGHSLALMMLAVSWPKKLAAGRNENLESKGWYIGRISG